MTIILRFYDLWVVFRGLRVFETEFSFKKTQISQFWYHEMFVFFLDLVFSQKTYYRRNLIVFSCLQFADCYIWPRILSCGVIFVFQSLLRNLFEKFSFKKSWCCRKHVFVFEIVSLKDLDKFMIKLSFSLWLLGKRFVRHYGRKLENFSILGVDFFLF